MKTYNEWLDLGEDRWSIREALRADVKTLQNVYRETREEGPAATVAAFVAAVGYSRAVAVVGTLVNRHAWDRRISRSVAAWAAALPDTWDEEAAQHFNVYVDDVIHLAHFDQIAWEMKKTTPPEDDDKRPETISADTVPETPETISAGSQTQKAAQEAPETISDAAAQVEQEAAPAPVPEAVALAPEAFRAVVESAPRCGLLFDLQGDALRYQTEDGRKRCIYTESVTVDGCLARIKYRNGSSRGQITLEKKHDCFPVAAVVAGTVSPSDALRDISETAGKLRYIVDADRDYFHSARKPAGSRKEEMKRNMKYASTLADQAACIIRNAADGIPLFISAIAGELETIAGAGKETGLGLTAVKHIEAVAAWIRETVAACIEAAIEAAKRPETISAGNPAPEAAQEAPAALPAPEKAQEAPQAAADVQPEPEARHRIQAPEKPACNPGKPLDFIGQVLSGNGWQIVFDANLQRTRVIIEKSAREKAAPLAESAGFYYSSNTDSWHKKLTHKAHRAAVALAEKLRAACA